jgi:hypothetical protein
MRKQNKRISYRSKSNNESIAYRNFIEGSVSLDKTIKDPVNTMSTKASSFDEDSKKVLGDKRKRPKSKISIIKKFLKNYVLEEVIAIIFIIILGFFGFIYSMNREQGVQKERVDTLTKNLEDSTKEKKVDQEKFDSFKEGFNIFKTETAKDLEFIRKKLKI